MDDGVIEGVTVSPEKRITNPKGDIFHAMKSSSQGFSGFGEAYFSIINPGVIKGWKRHRSATLNLVVPVGLVRFVVFDDRPESMSVGQFLDITIGGVNNARLTVSPGLWVAFTGVGDGLHMLLNISSEEHDPAEADNIELNNISYDWAL